MYKVIHDYVTTCDLCQRMKVDRKKQPPPPTHMPISDDVFPRLYMDILGPLPKVPGYQYVLLLVDSFSPWCEAFQLDNKMQNMLQVCCIMKSLPGMVLQGSL